jgi:predicted small secreted protein
MSRNKWYFVGLILTYLSTFALSACNTIEGVGRDVEAAGDAIEDTARDAKD